MSLGNTLKLFHISFKFMLNNIVCATQKIGVSIVIVLFDSRITCLWNRDGKSMLRSLGNTLKLFHISLKFIFIKFIKSLIRKLRYLWCHFDYRCLKIFYGWCNKWIGLTLWIRYLQETFRVGDNNIIFNVHIVCGHQTYINSASVVSSSEEIEK